MSQLKLQSPLHLFTSSPLLPFSPSPLLFICIICVLGFFALGLAIIPGAKNRQSQTPDAPPSRPLRVAVVGFVGLPAQPPETALAESLAKDERVVLLEQAQIKPALSAFGYDGSINLSLEEAKHLGASMGCDFFIIGKTDSATRSERAGESHEETFFAVMIVDARSGALAAFDFISKQAATREAARQQAAQTLSQQTKGYVEKMLAFRTARRPPAAPADEPVEDLPDTESAAGAGFKPPEFLNRVKPAFTQIADRADINATVEARAVFRAGGEVGEIQIIRWAGFGLDEAAADAIRQLKFRPATRSGHPVNVRALIRYNFRRVNQR